VTALRPYQPSDLPGLVAAWNHSFFGGPNFITLTERDLHSRVVLQPSFDAGGVLVADSGGAVSGFVHFGPATNHWFGLSERIVDPSEGLIWALVAPASEHVLMQVLLEAAEERLAQAGARRCLFGPSWVQCTQPFYNGIAGAYEMPGLSADRAELLKLLAGHGFVPVARYATPELDLSDERHLAHLGQRAEDVLRRLGASEMSVRMRVVASSFFPLRRVVELCHGPEPVAMAAFAPWEEHIREYGRKLYGVTGVQVALAWRGRGLGRVVMTRLAHLARNEGAEALHLHVYEGNRPAWNLYHHAIGFQPRYNWLTLAKDL